MDGALASLFPTVVRRTGRKAGRCIPCDKDLNREDSNRVAHWVRDFEQAHFYKAIQ
jgi:hypothetical protein